MGLKITSYSRVSAISNQCFPFEAPLSSSSFFKENPQKVSQPFGDSDHFVSQQQIKIINRTHL